MKLVRTTAQSNVGMRMENSAGDVLVLDAAQQKFAHLGLSTQSPIEQSVSVSSEKSVAVPTSDVRDCIAFEFSLLKEVAFVYTAFRQNDVFYAWIVIDKFERKIREAIYERQRVIIDEFPTFQFDFYIMGLDGRDVSDLIGDPSMHLTYSRD